MSPADLLLAYAVGFTAYGMLALSLRARGSAAVLLGLGALCVGMAVS